MMHLFLLGLFFTTTSTQGITEQQLSKLAQNYLDNEKYVDACVAAKQLCSTYPKRACYYFLHATALLALGYCDEAAQQYERSYQLDPTYIGARYNQGYALKCRRKLDEAITVYQEVIALQPDYVPAHIALGFAYLTRGDFEAGWQAHRYYLHHTGKDSPALEKLITNHDLCGKKILLLYEGGFGDTIQFIRYAQRFKQNNAIVYTYVQEPLIKLISCCPFIDIIVTQKELKATIDHVDATAFLMSLPALFNEKQTTIPNTVPYITIPTERISEWNNIIDPTYFNIGICWQPSVANDSSRLPIARRNIPLHYFEQLAKIPNVRLYSVQKIDVTEQCTNTFPITTFDQDFDTIHGAFIDSAALIHHLDLVISADTSIAHLAGALAKPVWLLLPYCADWRWITEQTTSPWYPTMRIFQQPKPFDWDTVFKQVAAALHTLVKQNNHYQKKDISP